MCPLQNHLKTATSVSRKKTRENIAALLSYLALLLPFPGFGGLGGLALRATVCQRIFGCFFFETQTAKSKSRLVGTVPSKLVGGFTNSIWKICCSSNWIILAQVIWVKNRKYVRNHHSLSLMVFFGVFKLSFQVNECNCQMKTPCSLKKCWIKLRYFRPDYPPPHPPKLSFKGFLASGSVVTKIASSLSQPGPRSQGPAGGSV